MAYDANFNKSSLSRLKSKWPNCYQNKLNFKKKTGSIYNKRQ